MKKIFMYCFAFLILFTGCGDNVVYPQIQTNTSHASLDKTSPVPITFEDLRNDYTLIVCADVIDTAPDTQVLGRDTNRTDCAYLKIREILKGDGIVGERIWVEDSFCRREMFDENGNWIETLENGWSGEPLMKKGNRVIVFLNPTENKTLDGKPCYTTAPYAKYYLDCDGLYHCSLLYSSFFLNYFYSDDDVDGIGFVPTDLVPKSIEDIKALICE